MKWASATTLEVCVCKRTNTHFFHIGLCKRLGLIANAFYLNEVLVFFPLLTYSKQNRQTNKRTIEKRTRKNEVQLTFAQIALKLPQIKCICHLDQLMLPIRSDETEKKRGGKVNRTMFTVHTYKSSPIFLLISSCVPNFVFFYSALK